MILLGPDKVLGAVDGTRRRLMFLPGSTCRWLPAPRCQPAFWGLYRVCPRSSRIILIFSLCISWNFSMIHLVFHYVSLDETWDVTWSFSIYRLLKFYPENSLGLSSYFLLRIHLVFPRIFSWKFPPAFLQWEISHFFLKNFLIFITYSPAC